MLQWRLGWQQKKKEKVRAKKEMRELWISRCRLSTKEQAKEQAKEHGIQKFGMKQVTKVERPEERIRGRGRAARKEEKGKKRVAKEIPEHVGRAVRQDTLQLGAEEEETQVLCAVDEDDGENADESTENEDDLQAWCLLEESENEQWQE